MIKKIYKLITPLYHLRKIDNYYRIIGNLRNVELEF